MKKVLTVKELSLVAASIPDSSALNLRNKTRILLAFAGFLHISEVLNLRLNNDIQLPNFGESCALVTGRSSKTDVVYKSTSVLQCTKLENRLLYLNWGLPCALFPH